MNCRFCHTELTHEFVDLGHQPPSNSFLTREQLDEPETYYPLRVMVCEKCWLVQLPEVKKAGEIFGEDYPYYSSQSPANVSHAKEYVEMMVERFHPNSVLEIGSNDGYLLQHFGNRAGVIGCDPSSGAAKEARKKKISTIVDFWGFRTARQYSFVEAPVDLICSLNTIAHQPDINDFVAGMKIALAPGGVITAEFPSLMRLVEGGQFDTIYHEHYNYFSLMTIYDIFDYHSLEIFDVDEIPEHGGSLRIYAQHRKEGMQAVFARVDDLIWKEMKKGINMLPYYTGFQYKVDKAKPDLVQILIDIAGHDEIVAAYGAPAKGNTLLNYCGIRSDLVQFAVDRSPYKQNKFLPGSHIPVYDEEYLKKVQPDYVLILPWNLKDEIVNQLSYIRSWGGKFIVAIPNLEVL
jgi:SAM-dependent methyltransferase